MAAGAEVVTGPWPDLAAIELLVAVADHGSLSAGARVVGMAQPNASRSMARLERQVRLALVQRTTSGSRLTPAGLLVVDWARAVLDAAHALREGASTLVADDSASLAVAASQTVAEHLLPTWLGKLRAAHPDLKVAVQVHNSATVLDDVRNGLCQLGFVEGPQRPSGLNSQIVARDQLVLVVGPQHPWVRRRNPLRAAELLATPLVTRESGSGTRVALDVALGGSAPALLELPSNAAVRVAVMSGVGPAVLSQLAVADAVSTGGLVEIPMADVEIRRSLRAVWAGPRRVVGPVAELINLAKAPVLRP